jgi:hypothetical protein
MATILDHAVKTQSISEKPFQLGCGKDSDSFDRSTSTPKE